MISIPCHSQRLAAASPPLKHHLHQNSKTLKLSYPCPPRLLPSISVPPTPPALQPASHPWPASRRHVLPSPSLTRQITASSCPALSISTVARTRAAHLASTRSRPRRACFLLRSTLVEQERNILYAHKHPHICAEPRQLGPSSFTWSSELVQGQGLLADHGWPMARPLAHRSPFDLSAHHTSIARTHYPIPIQLLRAPNTCPLPTPRAPLDKAQIHRYSCNSPRF